MSLWNLDNRSRAGYLKGELALAEADAKRSAELTQRIARDRSDLSESGTCVTCGDKCRPNGVRSTCDRCANREWMRKVRATMTTAQIVERAEKMRAHRKLKKAQRDAP